MARESSTILAVAILYNVTALSWHRILAETARLSPSDKVDGIKVQYYRTLILLC